MEKLPADISEIDKRIKQMKAKDTKSADCSSARFRYVARAGRIVLEFIAPVFVGLCIGFTLDKLCKTKVVFFIIGAIFGCMSGMLNIYREAKSIEQDANKEC